MSFENMSLPHGTIKLPVYLPDATFGVVRTVDAQDLERADIQAVVMNVFHLMQKPGSSTIQALNGLHNFSGWKRPIITDSGGFQVYSLIRQNPKMGRIQDKGAVFYSESNKRQVQLTPEKSIQLQLSYDSDVVICLDDCTHVQDSPDEQQKSVERTVKWAARCKKQYQLLIDQKKLTEEERPKIFAVVQGGADRNLRKQCADQLLEIGFDGYGYGGWPLDEEGNLVEDILGWTREIIPAEFPLHALGIGHPFNVVKSFQLGYQIFDSAMPTRDARHGRLYRFTDKSAVNAGNSNWFEYLYINDEQHVKSAHPVSDKCDCFCCQNYSTAYLRHLFKMNDSLYYRLATIHNLQFMTDLMKKLRGE